eukprot:TRINITY_DN6029_c0_g1_i8.p1 TRINITY_DN6029_c0_g1~~TRINITY_DN6029_c0_g1_i8.p1  ORF type:complete len:108 (-),score=0.96 TRINITY_DN6029_c0_g1_i8:52-375(-)
MPTCEYRYNKLKKQIMVVPVSEEYIFATYFAAATLVHGELRASTATHQPQVPVIKAWLDQLAATSTWTVVADPHRVLLPVSYTHLRAHETRHDLVCRLLLEKKKKTD